MIFVLNERAVGMQGGERHEGGGQREGSAGAGERREGALLQAQSFALSTKRGYAAQGSGLRPPGGRRGRKKSIFLRCAWGASEKDARMRRFRTERGLRGGGSLRAGG